MQQQIIHQTFDEERALYALRDAEVMGCTFAGPADGESALKESKKIKAHNCKFSLRYPLWHAEDFLLSDSHMEETARAPMWYTRLGTVRHSRIEAPKALRECDDTLIEGSVIRSDEFGWKCRTVAIRSSSVSGAYLFFEAKNLEISRLNMEGKYSFQYVENATFDDCVLDTKDAFWHGKNITVRNSTLKGEYLAWYSEGLTLINCHIEGTQPFCYCKNLRLVNCTMAGTDLAFEYSEVEADVEGEILSVKNPKTGSIRAHGFGEIIRENAVMDTDCRIEIKKA